MLSTLSVIDDSDDIAYDGENIVQYLQLLAECEEPWNENITCLICDKQVKYWAPPVLMAVCMKQYDLAKMLVEAGYPTTSIWSNNTIESVHGICWVNLSPNSEDDWLEGGFHSGFNLTEMIMGAPDMPDDIRLFLWDKVKSEKGLHWKENRQQGYIFDVTHDSSQKINAVVGFGIEILPSEKRTIYEKCFMMTFLLEKVAHTDEQKLDLLYFYKRLTKYTGEKSLLKNGYGFCWVNTYCDIQKFYKNTQLQDEYYRCMLSEAIDVYQRNYGRYEYWSQEERDAEQQFLNLLKQVQPKELTVDQFVAMVYRVLLEDEIEGCFDIKRSWMDVIARNIFMQEDYIDYLYECLYERQVKYQYEKKDTNAYLDLFKDEQKQICLNHIKHWLEEIPQFSFCKSKPLNKRQLLILYCGDEQVLMMALEKRMFEKIHYSMAIDFCWNNTDCRLLLPCMLAYGEEFLSDEVE